MKNPCLALPAHPLSSPVQPLPFYSLAVSNWVWYSFGSRPYDYAVPWCANGDDRPASISPSWERLVTTCRRKSPSYPVVPLASKTNSVSSFPRPPSCAQLAAIHRSPCCDRGNGVSCLAVLLLYRSYLTTNSTTPFLNIIQSASTCGTAH